MASTSQCKYCGSTVSSADEHCPNCGAPNEGFVAETERQIFLPKTIDELKEYCSERGMPLLKMRFFIGEDYREPKAFGIYRDGSDFIVYKKSGAVVDDTPFFGKISEGIQAACSEQGYRLRTQYIYDADFSKKDLE